MKICIVQIGQLGDMILLTALFRLLAEARPDAELHVLASPKNAVIARATPHIFRVYEFDKRPFRLLPLLARLHAEHFDYWLDPKDHASRQSAFLVRIARPNISVGFNEIGKKSVFTHTISPSKTTLHQVLQNLLVLEKIGIKPPFLQDIHAEIYRPTLVLHADSEKFTREFLGNSAPIVLNISAGNDSRRWVETKWAALATTLLSAGFSVVISHAPHHADRALAITTAEPQAKIFPSRSIFDVISLLSRARLLITPDTAPVHIAAAFDTPVLGLYPQVEWNIQKFCPLSSHSVVLQSSSETLESIPETEVIAVALEMLNKSISQKKLG